MAKNKQHRKMRVLFVCLGNACRSPMAEAFARHIASDVMIPSSAGTIALGTIAPFTTRVLEERGYNASFLQSKLLTRQAMKEADIVVNMTGIPNEPHFKHNDPRVLEWQILDPYNGPYRDYVHACDDIEVRITELAARLRAQMHPDALKRSVSLDGDADSAAAADPA